METANNRIELALSVALNLEPESVKDSLLTSLENADLCLVGGGTAVVNMG